MAAARAGALPCDDRGRSPGRPPPPPSSSSLRPSLAPGPGRAIAPKAPNAPGPGIEVTPASDLLDAPEPDAPDDRPRGKLEGVVLDDVGVPVPGARVRATGGPEANAVACGTDGRFVLDGLVVDVEYSLEAQGPRHATGTAGPFRVLLGTTPAVEVRLPASRFLELVVLDAASATPVPGATVVLDRGSDPPARRTAGRRCATDAKGHVRVGPVPSAAVDLRISAQGYLQASRSIPVGSEGSIEVNLSKALLLSGRVLRPDGSPARGATVSLRFGPDAVPILHTAGWLSDDDQRGRRVLVRRTAARARAPRGDLHAVRPTEGNAASEPETGAADPDAGASDCVIRCAAPPSRAAAR